MGLGMVFVIFPLLFLVRIFTMSMDGFTTRVETMAWDG